MSERWSAQPEPDAWWEPHVLDDVSGLIIHESSAQIDSRGRVVDSTNPDVLDLFWEDGPTGQHPAEDFREWMGGAFVTSHSSSTFDYISGSAPPWQTNVGDEDFNA